MTISDGKYAIPSHMSTIFTQHSFDQVQVEDVEVYIHVTSGGVTKHFSSPLPPG